MFKYTHHSPSITKHTVLNVCRQYTLSWPDNVAWNCACLCAVLRRCAVVEVSHTLQDRLRSVPCRCCAESDKKKQTDKLRTQHPHSVRWTRWRREDTPTVRCVRMFPKDFLKKRYVTTLDLFLISVWRYYTDCTNYWKSLNTLYSQDFIIQVSICLLQLNAITELFISSLQTREIVSTVFI